MAYGINILAGRGLLWHKRIMWHHVAARCPLKRINGRRRQLHPGVICCLPGFCTFSSLCHLLLLGQADVLMKCWCCLQDDIVITRVSVLDKHEKEQGMSLVKDFLGMAGLEGRVVVCVCKLLLEGHFKCMSRIPQRPGLLLSPVTF